MHIAIVGLPMSLPSGRIVASEDLPDGGKNVLVLLERPFMGATQAQLVLTAAERAMLAAPGPAVARTG